MALHKRDLGVKHAHANSTVSTHVSKGLEPGQAFARVRSRARHIAQRAAKRRAGRGGRGRSVHLAAPENNEDEVVVARLKERPCSLAWDASEHDRKMKTESASARASLTTVKVKTPPK